MKYLAVLALPLLAYAAPASSAEIDVYDREVIVAPAPVVTDRVVERRYYYYGEPVAPRYRMPHVYQDGWVGSSVDRKSGFGGSRYSDDITYWNYKYSD